MKHDLPEIVLALVFVAVCSLIILGVSAQVKLERECRASGGRVVSDKQTDVLFQKIGDVMVPMVVETDVNIRCEKPKE